MRKHSDFSASVALAVGATSVFMFLGGVTVDGDRQCFNVLKELFNGFIDRVMRVLCHECCAVECKSMTQICACCSKFDECVSAS